MTVARALDFRNAADRSRADRAFRSWLERYELMDLIDPDRF
jgi:hypothetical protein